MVADREVSTFSEGEKNSSGRSSLRYCGSPTFRTSSANRGSERTELNLNSVLNPSSNQSRS